MQLIYHELQTKKLKKVRLFKKNERKEVKSSVSEEELLTYVINTASPKFLVPCLLIDKSFGIPCYQKCST